MGEREEEEGWGWIQAFFRAWLGGISGGSSKKNTARVPLVAASPPPLQQQ